MSCKYCDIRKRRNSYLNCEVESGKPYLEACSETRRAWWGLMHEGPCPGLPEQDECRLELWEGGRGSYLKINYCPWCGRELGGEQ